MPEIKALISDADGTQVSTVRLIRHGQYEAAFTYLKQHGVPDDLLPTYAEYEPLLNKHVGGKVAETLERTIRDYYRDALHHIEAVDYEEVARLNDVAQDRLAAEYVKPYPGLDESLLWLGQHGIKFAISTSGTKRHVVRNYGIALPELGLTDLYKNQISDDQKLDVFMQRMNERYKFAGFTVVTCEDVERGKPYPDNLELAMQRLDVTSSECAVLGDHVVDMQVGRAAGVPYIIGITHGFDDRTTLEATGATQVIDQLSELPSILVAK
jgi:phosphoglycolate phosphatase-like HAD superfamily hydrolase